MFDPLQTWSFGPLTIASQMLFFIIAVGIGYTGIYLYLKYFNIEKKEEILDALMTSAIIGILTFKFWPFILEPSLLLTPRNLILYIGGPFAVYVALVSAIGYFIYKNVRKSWTYHSWDSLAIGVVIMLIIYTFFLREFGEPSPFSIGYFYEGIRYHPVNFYQSGLYCMLLGSNFVLVPSNKKFVRSIYLLLGIVVIAFIIAPFQV